jgi:phosphatidylserine decarboxylase
MHLAVSRHGIPFLFFSLVVILLSIIITMDWTNWARYPVILSGVVLFLLFLQFFRDPERISPSESGLILAPADGRIIKVSEETDDVYPGKHGVLISIFMSLWNVHVNRVPFSGKVTRKNYQPGRFLPAFKNEASQQNEQCSLIIETDGQSVLLRQVSGILARRIITYPKEGDSVKRGERLGMILFGSRLDLIVPSETKVMISHGDKTIAGKTVVGIF